MVILYYTLLVGYILLWHYGTLVLHCYKMVWKLQCYMTLHALVCLLQFAMAKIRVCWCCAAGSTHASSPFNLHFSVLYTCDGDAAWAAAEGIIPIPDGLNTEGFTSALIVRGITYQVPSLGLSHYHHYGPSRRLFEEYTGIVQTGLQASMQAVLQSTIHLDTHGVGLLPDFGCIHSHAYSLACR